MSKSIVISYDVSLTLDSMRLPKESYDAVLRKVLEMEPPSKRGTRIPGVAALKGIAVGQSVLIPWMADEHGDPATNQGKLHRSIGSVGQRYHLRFSKQAKILGLYVTRVK